MSESKSDEKYYFLFFVKTELIKYLCIGSWYRKKEEVPPVEKTFETFEEAHRALKEILKVCERPTREESFSGIQ